MESLIFLIQVRDLIYLYTYVNRIRSLSKQGLFKTIFANHLYEMLRTHDIILHFLKKQMNSV